MSNPIDALVDVVFDAFDLGFTDEEIAAGLLWASRVNDLDIEALRSFAVQCAAVLYSAGDETHAELVDIYKVVTTGGFK